MEQIRQTWPRVPILPQAEMCTGQWFYLQRLYRSKGLKRITQEICEGGEEELLLQELERQEVAEGSRRGVRHSFGSAADMPPPPVPKGPQVRQASPVQLIERDNSAEFLVDPRLAKKKTRTATEDEDVDYRPERAESPVWDIELDLNDD